MSRKIKTTTVRDKKNKIFQLPKNLPISYLLVIPFVLEIFAVVGIVGYFSFRNGQQAVNKLATQLQTEVSERVTLHLDNYLATAKHITQINARAIELGLIDLNDYQTSGRYFWHQIQTYQNVGYIDYILPTGEYVGAGRWLEGRGVTIDEISARTNWNSYTYTTDPHGNRTEMVYESDYAPLEETWYQETVKAKKPIWNQVYAWEDFPDILSVATSFPVYNSDSSLIAIAGVDLQLKGFSSFLRNLEVSPSTKIFVIEPNGLIIADSSKEPPYKFENGEAQRLKVFASQDRLIQATAKQLQQQFGSFERIDREQRLVFDLDGKKQFAKVTPWQDELGLDWLVVVAMSESDFMAEINANSRTTIFLCLAALIMAIILGLKTASWITKPIHRLNDASSAIAKGDLEQTIEIRGVKELNILAGSFNQMASQLKISFAKLDRINQELEHRVEERTVEFLKAKKTAETASRAKSEFLSNMSHELRTPLNGILGYAQILQRDRSLTSQQIRGINVIYSSGNHLLTLINDILDISKIEAGKLELFNTDIELEPFFAGLEDIVRMRAIEKNISFASQAVTPLPTGIIADEKRLRQVLLNLLSNAIKFTDTGEVILKVSASYATATEESNLQTFRFEVVDTGIGMNPQQLDKIFHAFEQVGDLQRQQEGTGLGLAISKQLVELMGGKLQVSSESGKGSTFWFEVVFPVIEMKNRKAIERQNRQIVGYQEDSKHILIVDDREENRLVLQNMLEPLGFKITLAKDGQQEVDLALKTKPDCILTDLMMPVKSGFEAVKEIRRFDSFKDVVIIAISASVSDAERRQSRSFGCDDFLPKPVEEVKLLAALQKYLQLTWIYETKASLQNESVVTEAVSLKAPPPEEMEKLYELAMLGSMKKIKEQAMYLEELDQKYAPLAAKLKNLANGFQEKAIVNLIEQFL
ncbi:hybrid sensor histidine kinase/response regulator [Myxosarcina sp. GI1]|uniref:hybrid sensor histidine kinase/response regulator n=1 Tax=Myxosarcina sp. GI1 TaxID=1541065 RepID=UPI000689C811|nr:hybrid sensor histidine kinase/response regulator [Myxosarcina sp. GI1]